jgi:hypothetical protein
MLYARKRGCPIKANCEQLRLERVKDRNTIMNVEIMMDVKSTGLVGRHNACCHAHFPLQVRILQFMSSDPYRNAYPLGSQVPYINCILLQTSHQLSFLRF